MNLNERCDNLDAHIARGTLIRHAWTQGKERACLLAALSPEAGKEQSAHECPAEVMPQWLAQLTPWIDDLGSDEHWPAVVRRYAALARRWHVLTHEQWERLDYQVRAICVREAVEYTSKKNVLQVCEDVVALCDRAASGDMPMKGEWAEAARAAAAAEAEAAWAAEAEAAAVWAAAAAEEAAGTAAWAAARAAAVWAAADCIIDQILDAIETEIVKGEDSSNGNPTDR